MYDPETSRVESELKERGYWEGGSTSSIFTPSLSEGLVQPVDSGTLSAVNSGSFNNSLQEQLAKLKLPAVGLTVGLGSGIALPEGAQAAGRGSENGAPLVSRRVLTDAPRLRLPHLRRGKVGNVVF